MAMIVLFRTRVSVFMGLVFIMLTLVRVNMAVCASISIVSSVIR